MRELNRLIVSRLQPAVTEPLKLGVQPAKRFSGNVTAEVSRVFIPDEWSEIVARLR